MICRDFMNKKCTRENCRFVHDTKLCYRFWKNGSCKYGVNCRKHHELPTDPRPAEPSRPRDHKTFHRERRGDDMTNKCVDMRVVVEQSKDSLNQENNKLSTKDIVLVPNVFSEFAPNELFQKLLDEVNNCGIPKEDLFKLWHSDCHFIADDKMDWKDKVPTFKFIIERMKRYFGLRVEATRLNFFTGEQFKHWHHDRASFHKKTAEKQNFTICLNLGAKRTVGFRREGTRTIITTPVDDGHIYCFSNQINIDWEHAVLKSADPGGGLMV
jgi:hypothetical protein